MIPPPYREEHRFSLAGGDKVVLILFRDGSMVLETQDHGHEQAAGVTLTVEELGAIGAVMTDMHYREKGSVDK